MLDTFRDGMEIINSSQENANERKAAVEQAAQGLGLEDITKDGYSNLTAVTNAQAIFRVIYRLPFSKRWQRMVRFEKNCWNTSMIRWED